MTIKLTKNRTAFTLAEVLVTLAIIGVVASLTIPSLMKSWQDTANKAAYKKQFTVLKQAFLMAKIDNGNTAIQMCTAYNNNCILGKLSPYIKNVKTCNKYGVADNCFSSYSTLKNLNGDPYDTLTEETLDSYSGIVTPDGAFLLFNWSNPDCGAGSDVHEICGYIIADVNGLKTPNTNGLDIFYFYFTKNEIKPYGYRNEYWLDCDRSGDGTSCGMNIIKGINY